MVTEDQSEVVAFLGSPAAHGGEAVERVDTHASIVFLSGDRALKLKRAVRYAYLDFSTVERRRAMCEAELRVNRRTAPAIYRAVIPVTRAPDGGLALRGTGPAVDWVLEMARFDQEALLDRLAERGALPLAAMAALAAQVARFHDRADRRRDHGGQAGIRRVIEGNATGFSEAAGILDAAACQRVTAASFAALEQQGALLEARRAGGFVRHCHGDLHLRNIVLLDGVPTLFDAIEFNEDISCIDVLYDVAFLLMDLWHRALPEHANAIWNAYLAGADDFQGLPLLPLFLSCRAAIRAQTSAAGAALATGGGARAAQETAARDYLTLAEALLRPAAPLVLAIGGWSGSGKSTLARAVAPAIGAAPGGVIVRSDEIRKRLCGVEPLTRLDASGYTAEVTRRVYEALGGRAVEIASNGYGVVVDAVFGDPSERKRVETLAVGAGLPFVGIWLEAPEDVLVTRVAGRRGDPSDADAAVVRTQVSRDPGPIHWHRLPGWPVLGLWPLRPLRWLPALSARRRALGGRGIFEGGGETPAPAALGFPKIQPIPQWTAPARAVPPLMAWRKNMAPSACWWLTTKP